MKDGYFILNDLDSEDYGTFIQERPKIETPTRRVRFKRAFGADGDEPFDEESYDNTTLSLSMYVEGNDIRTASANRDAIYDMFDSGYYMDFIPYFDPTKIYKVMTVNPPAFEPHYKHGEGQPFEVELMVKPYKYYNTDAPIVLTSAGSISNLTSKTSLPRITIMGTGNITLTINGVSFVMQGIVDTIVLDSQLSLAYKVVAEIIMNENSKVYTRTYPYLSKGINSISWTGTVTSVTIEPRWRTLA